MKVRRMKKTMDDKEEVLLQFNNSLLLRFREIQEKSREVCQTLTDAAENVILLKKK